MKLIWKTFFTTEASNLEDTLNSISGMDEEWNVFQIVDYGVAFGIVCKRME